MHDETKQMTVLGKFPQGLLGIIILPIFLAFIVVMCLTVGLFYTSFLSVDPTMTVSELGTRHSYFYLALGGSLLLGIQVFLVSLISRLAKNSDIVAEAYKRWQSDLVTPSEKSE
jgi:hypothetical protein